METLTTGHIRLDGRGVAWIDDANVKVIEVVLDKLAYGWDADEIHAQHPHLAPAQIHAALAYHYDHQLELDAEIDRRRAEVEVLMAQADASPRDLLICGALADELGRTRDEQLRRELEAAMKDPLFLKDLRETEKAFQTADSETAIAHSRTKESHAGCCRPLTTQELCDPIVQSVRRAKDHERKARRRCSAR